MKLSKSGLALITLVIGALFFVQPLSADDAKVTSTLLYQDIHSSADEPLVIEGLTITTDGDGIILRNCDNVIIRDCSITYCAYTEENIEIEFSSPGMGLLIENCSNVTVENCIVSYNLMGLKVIESTGITLRGNVVSNNVYQCGIMLLYCTDCLVTENVVEDNGFPERFYECGGGKRIIGIYIICGGNIEISYNRSCRNTSDGMLVGGQDYFLEDNTLEWKGLVTDISVHDNYIADNHEQGIWVARARDCQFYNNEIHVDCSDIGIGSGICFELDVVDCEVWGNSIYACKAPTGVVMAVSHDNYFHDNVLHTFEDAEFLVDDNMMKNYDASDDMQKAKLAGIEYRTSYGNVTENNAVYVNGVPMEEHPDNEEDEGGESYLFLVAVPILALLACLLLWIRRKRD